MNTYTFKEYHNYLDLRPYQRQKQIEKAVTCTLAIGLIMSECAIVNAAGLNTARLDSRGRIIVNTVLRLSRWSVLLMAGWEGTKAILAGNAKGTPQIILKYGLSYAALKALPWVMDEIDRLFS